MPEALDLDPLGLRVRLRHARGFPHPLDLHRMFELDLGFLNLATDRCGGRRFRRAGERDVPFACEQSRCGIEADPTGAREVNLAPSMQIREIRRRSSGPIQRFHVCCQLNEVARNEARRYSEVTQQLHEQPTGVAAGAGRSMQSLLWRLHPWLHANQIANVPGQSHVQPDKKVDRAHAFAWNRCQELGEPRGGRSPFEVRREFALLTGLVHEGEMLRVWFEKKVERVEYGGLRNQVYFDAQFGRLVGEGQARQIVCFGILLPVDEMFRGMYRE